MDFNFERTNSSQIALMAGKPLLCLSCYFCRVYIQHRAKLTLSPDGGRRTGAFICALSTDKNRLCLRLPPRKHSLFSCRFKCPCPPRRQRHFQAKSCAKGCSFGTPLRGHGYAVTSQCKRWAISLPPIAHLFLSHSACRLPNLNVPQCFPLLGVSHRRKRFFYYLLAREEA